MMMKYMNNIQKKDKDEDEIINNLTEKMSRWYGCYSDYIDIARDNLYFLYVDQWDDEIKSHRQKFNKPTLTFNKILPILNGILGDFRSHTPALTLRAVNAEIDQKEVEWREGLIRQIHYENRMDVVYQHALKSTLETGWAGIKLDIEYEDGDTFDQCIKIAALDDYQMGFWDDSAKLHDKSDGDFCGYLDAVSRDEFESKYPEIDDPESIKNDNFYVGEDQQADVIIICNMYVKEYFKKKIAKMSDGRVLEYKEAKEEVEKVKSMIETLQAAQSELLSRLSSTMTSEMSDGDDYESGSFLPFLPDSPQPIPDSPFSQEIPQLLEIVDTREVDDYKIMFYRFIGNHILDKSEWPTKKFPIIYVQGNETKIDGESIPLSYIKEAIDAQRMINYFYSEISYAVLRARKEQYLGTPENFKNFEKIWRDPDNVQGALYANVDPQTRQLPARQSAPAFDQTLLSGVNAANQEISMVLGRYEENKGQESNAQSGIAIAYRQQAGDNVVNLYIDNVCRAAESVGRLILDLIPHVYNDERNVLIRGIDGSPSQIKINSQQNQGFNINGDSISQRVENDTTLSSDEFSVEVSVADSYDVQRQKSLQTLISFAQTNPSFAQIIPDLIAEESGLENTPELVKRAKTLLPPQILAIDGEQPTPQQQKQIQQQQMQEEMKAKMMQQQAQMAEKQLELQEGDLQLKAKKLMLDEQELKIKEMEAKLKSQTDHVKSYAEIKKAELQVQEQIAKRGDML